MMEIPRPRFASHHTVANKKSSSNNNNKNNNNNNIPASCLGPWPGTQHHQDFMTHHRDTTTATTIEVASANLGSLLILPVADIIQMPEQRNNAVVGATPNNNSFCSSSNNVTPRGPSHSRKASSDSAVSSQSPAATMTMTTSTTGSSTSTEQQGQQQVQPKTLRLCPYFDASSPDTMMSSCPKGARCRHVHAITDNAVTKDVHVNHIWDEADECPYESFPAGSNFHVAIPNGATATDEIPSHLVLKTRILESNRRVMSHCAHYYFNRTCNRGSSCYFVHAVSLKPRVEEEEEEDSVAKKKQDNTDDHHADDNKKPTHPVKQKKHVGFLPEVRRIWGRLIGDQPQQQDEDDDDEEEGDNDNNNNNNNNNKQEDHDGDATLQSSKQGGKERSTSASSTAKNINNKSLKKHSSSSSGVQQQGAPAGTTAPPPPPPSYDEALQDAVEPMQPACDVESAMPNCSCEYCVAFYATTGVAAPLPASKKASPKTPMVQQVSSSVSSYSNNASFGAYPYDHNHQQQQLNSPYASHSTTPRGVHQHYQQSHYNNGSGTTAVEHDHYYDDYYSSPRKPQQQYVDYYATGSTNHYNNADYSSDAYYYSSSDSNNYYYHAEDAHVDDDAQMTTEQEGDVASSSATGLNSPAPSLSSCPENALSDIPVFSVSVRWHHNPYSLSSNMVKKTTTTMMMTESE